MDGTITISLGELLPIAVVLLVVVAAIVGTLLFLKYKSAEPKEGHKGPKETGEPKEPGKPKKPKIPKIIIPKPDDEEDNDGTNFYDAYLKRYYGNGESDVFNLRPADLVEPGVFLTDDPKKIGRKGYLFIGSDGETKIRDDVYKLFREKKHYCIQMGNVERFGTHYFSTDDTDKTYGYLPISSRAKGEEKASKSSKVDLFDGTQLIIQGIQLKFIAKGN